MKAPLALVSYAIRLGLVVGLLLGGVRYLAGGDPLEAILLALFGALVVLLIGGYLLDRLESPEQRLARRRAEYEKRRRKQTTKKAEKPTEKNAEKKAEAEKKPAE